MSATSTGQVLGATTILGGISALPMTSSLPWYIKILPLSLFASLALVSGVKIAQLLISAFVKLRSKSVVTSA